MFLANKFIERARPHPCRERRAGVRQRKIDIFLAEQIMHEGKIRRAPGLCT
jgi:hypothetical protein